MSYNKKMSTRFYPHTRGGIKAALKKELMLILKAQDIPYSEQGMSIIKQCVQETMDKYFPQNGQGENNV